MVKKPRNKWKKPNLVVMVKAKGENVLTICKKDETYYIYAGSVFGGCQSFTAISWPRECAVCYNLDQS
ncbi:MAG: hypothetical protein ABIG92_01825 [Candidatus Omnitrophota bacterium]